MALELQYNNPAGRLLCLLQAFSKKPGGKFADFARLTGVDEDCDAVLTAVADIRAEFRLLSEAIERIEDNSPKRELFRKHLPDIEISVNSFVLQIGSRSYTVSVMETALVSLQFMAADLAQEELPPDADLEMLKSEIATLQKLVRKAEIAPLLRNWLLDLIRLMRDGIDRYQIRRSRGLKQSLHAILGDMIANYEFRNDVHKNHPDIWGHFGKVLDIMVKVSEVHERYKPAIDHVIRALPLIGVVQ